MVAPPAGRVEGAAVDAETVAKRARESGPLRLAFLGNVIPRKGVETLLEGVARVDRAWELTVVGSLEADPAYADAVVGLAADLGVADRVTFAGELPDDDLESVLARSHVLAVPATYEGFGMAYLEAMEYGVVPVASAVGGAREFVDDWHDGVLVDPDDPGAVASVVDRLAADRDELAALGTRALETAAAHPTWAETLEQVRSFLLERAEQNGSRRSVRTRPDSSDRARSRDGDDGGDRP